MADAMITRGSFLNNEVVDLREEIALVSPTDTPLTTLLMGRGQVVPATDITVTWRERQLNSTRGTLKKEGADAGMLSYPADPLFLIFVRLSKRLLRYLAQHRLLILRVLVTALRRRLRIV